MRIRNVTQCITAIATATVIAIATTGASQAAPQYGPTTTVKITKLKDGDSGWMQDVNTGVEDEFRLWGIDTPEWGTPLAKFSNDAKRWLREQSEDTTWTRIKRQDDRDTFGREVVALVDTSQDVEVNAVLVKAGLAIDCPRYSRGHYGGQERHARQQRKGMWGVTKPAEIAARNKMVNASKCNR